MGRMFKGFKEFIARGNVMELAVGLIIGAAFGKIVDALVNSVLMPAIAVLFGGKEPNFDNWLQIDGTGIKIGVLITAVVNFLIIALAVYFVIVVPMNKLAERRAAKLGLTEEEEVDPQIQLLTEIRDQLAQSNSSGGGSHAA